MFFPLGFVFAQESCEPKNGKICSPLEFDGSLVDFLNLILNQVIVIGAIIAALAIIYSGYLFVTASGNPEKLKVAKQTILWVVIGSGLVLGANALVDGISETLKGLQV